MLTCGIDYQVRSYDSYKKTVFNKKLEKLRLLIGSIDDTSLKPDDKKKLKTRMKIFLNGV